MTNCKHCGSGLSPHEHVTPLPGGGYLCEVCVFGGKNLNILSWESFFSDCLPLLLVIGVALLLVWVSK